MTTDDTAHTLDAAARVRGLWSFRGRYRTLHLTWLAFFLTFVVWFNFAPFATTIAAEFGLTKAQVGMLGLCNVALTIPARLVVGMVLDRFGPRRVFAGVLLFAAIPCTTFALADTFAALVVSRLALGVVGAGFVVGIRMVAEWFPPREVGFAEGVYGGWGNFGAAAAAFTLPALAAVLGGADGWRWAIGLTGALSAAYGLYYLGAVQDTPPGAVYARPRRQGALEVTSRGGVWALAALVVPPTAGLGIIVWRTAQAGLIGRTGAVAGVAVLAVLLAAQLRAAFRVNRPALANEYPPEDRYPVRSVAVLCLAYACTFGSELAVVSMLPAHVEQTWGLSPAAAGAVAGVFAFMNLFARPMGGLLSDLAGSRRRALRAILAGLTVGYAAMAVLGARWPVGLAAAVILFAAFFPSAGNGAVYAIVPLVKKRVSGQVAGLVGAYGNVGALVFLTVLLFVPPWAFFLVLAAASVLATVACRWLGEPSGDAPAVETAAATADPLVEQPA